MLDLEIFRLLLLYQEGLLCSCCQEVELRSKTEIEDQLCWECYEYIEASFEEEAA